jgi:hypothetical protein
MRDNKNRNNKKIKEFELSQEFQEKYPDFTQICIKGKNLVLTTYTRKFVYSRYYDDDIKKTLEVLKEEFLNNENVEINFTDNLMDQFLQDFGQMLTWKLIGDPQEEEEDTRSLSEQLVDLVCENASLLFNDDCDIHYARVYNKDHYELIKIGSEKFRRYISKLYYDIEGKVLYSESIISAVSVLRARAEYEGQTVPLSLRVAWHNNGDIYYDMTNSKWQCVRITKDGWQLIDSCELPTPLFKRYNQIAQVTPVKEYEANILDKFLGLTNLKREDDKILLAVYIISLFIPSIQHVALQLHGEKGSAKSILQRFIKRIVDPAKPELLSVHKDRMEFIQQISHNHLVFYDNLKYVPSWLSSEVCSAITGSGGSKRALYTDDDDIVYEYKRCFGFNGINLVLTESDALDRSIVIEQKSIEPKYRIAEQKILADFDELRPRLLGYILDIIVKALAIKQSVELELKYLPRMGDFAIWGESIARALGHDAMKFMSIYDNNIARQNMETIESNVLGQCISKFINDGKMDSEGYWCGFTTDFLKELNVLAYNHNIDTNSKTWPKSVNSLSRKLKTIMSNIREGLGYDISIVRETSGKNKGASFMEIRKISSPSSPSSLKENHAQNEAEKGKNSEDISCSEDMYLNQDSISSPKMLEFRAQNLGSEDSEGSEDISPTLPEDIYRLGSSDTWGCHDCRIKGDKWFMIQHNCGGKK